MSSCLPVCLCLCDYRDRVLIMVEVFCLSSQIDPLMVALFSPLLLSECLQRVSLRQYLQGGRTVDQNREERVGAGDGVGHSQDYHEPLCIIMFISVSPFHRCSCRSSSSCLSICVVTPAQLVPAGGTTVSLFPLQLQTSRHTTATLRSVLFVVVLVDFLQLLKCISSNTGSTRNMQ